MVGVLIFIIKQWTSTVKKDIFSKFYNINCDFVIGIRKGSKTRGKVSLTKGLNSC